MKRTIQAIIIATVIVLTCIGCGGGGRGGGGASGNTSKNPTPGPAPELISSVGVVYAPSLGVETEEAIITGQAFYEDNQVDYSTALLTGNLVKMPIRGAVVESYDPANDTVLASTVTDKEGNFLLPGAEGRTIRVRVMSDSGLEYAPMKVHNSKESVYFVTTPDLSFQGAIRGRRDLELLAPADTALGRIGGAFNALDTIIAGVEFIRAAERRIVDRDPSFQRITYFPPLHIFWTVGEAHEPIGCTCFTEVEDNQGNRSYGLMLEDFSYEQNDYDDSVILHEWGHYLQRVASWSSSPGGQHQSNELIDYRLAFNEAFGNAFSGMVLGIPVYADTGVGQPFVRLDLESPDVKVQGPGSELACQGILWDLFDGVNDDPIHLGFDPIWHAMRALRVRALKGDRHQYMRHFQEELVRLGYITDNEWNQAFAAGPFAMRAPIDRRGIENYAPTLQAGANYMMGWVDASMGRDNLLDSNAYFMVTLPYSGTLTIGLGILDSQTNLDLVLWEDLSPEAGVGESVAATPLDNNERTKFLETKRLAAGTYLLAVRARAGEVGAAQAKFRLQVNYDLN